MNKKLALFTLALIALAACRHPEVEITDFDTFKVLSVNTSDVFMPDGSLNPEISLMEDYGEDLGTKVAATSAMALVRDVAGVVNSNRLIHIAGTYTGHDIDGSPLTLSGKLLIPASGEIKNLILVSHYTIGANYESPSNTFPLEGMLAAKGYAVAVADYIGFGVTAGRVHPYMHTESTARSVVDFGLAVVPYLEHIGRKPESEKVILFGYSQGGATTMAVMDIIQDECRGKLPIKIVYAGGGPYDLAATFDVSMQQGLTGIPCAIPMIVQGVNVGERLGLDMADFFEGSLLENYDEWINSKKYSVKEINLKIGSNDLREIMTENGRDKTNKETARLYGALLANSTLNFTPFSPIYLFHSREDQTVPFINSVHAEAYFKGRDMRIDFGDYGSHGMGCVRFIMTVYKDLP